METNLAKRLAFPFRCAQTGKRAQATRRRPRFLFHHKATIAGGLIIRRLPDRGFKSRPRNQSQSRLRSDHGARFLFGAAETSKPYSRRYRQLVRSRFCRTLVPGEDAGGREAALVRATF